MKPTVVILLAGSAIGLTGSIAFQGQQPSGPAGASPQVIAGKKLFLQRCSICHLPPLGPNPQAPYGPKLNGYLRGPERETRAREAIAKGTPRMPGFEYGLSAKEIDDLIAYLKAL